MFVVDSFGSGVTRGLDCKVRRRTEDALKTN